MDQHLNLGLRNLITKQIIKKKSWSGLFIVLELWIINMIRSIMTIIKSYLHYRIRVDPWLKLLCGAYTVFFALTILILETIGGEISIGFLTQQIHYAIILRVMPSCTKGNHFYLAQLKCLITMKIVEKLGKRTCKYCQQHLVNRHNTKDLCLTHYSVTTEITAGLAEWRLHLGCHPAGS